MNPLPCSPMKIGMLMVIEIKLIQNFKKNSFNIDIQPSSIKFTTKANM